MLNSLSNKKILVVVAHPDDEVLGLGATINRLISQQENVVKAVILGEGITSRSKERNIDEWKSELELHHSNTLKAAAVIGYHGIRTYNFPDNRFDSVDLLEIIKVIEKEKSEFKPDVIFTHHGGDVNIDHQKTFEAVITACRPLENETVKTIITFETMSGTEWRASTDPRHFIPNLFFSVEKSNLDAKIKAMESYEYEKREYPHPRSPQALKIRAQMWGVSIGVNFVS